MRKQRLFLQFSECHVSGGVSAREYTPGTSRVDQSSSHIQDLLGRQFHQPSSLFINLYRDLYKELYICYKYDAVTASSQSELQSVASQFLENHLLYTHILSLHVIIKSQSLLTLIIIVLKNVQRLFFVILIANDSMFTICLSHLLIIFC